MIIEQAKNEIKLNEYTELDHAWVAQAFLDCENSGVYKIAFHFDDVGSAQGFCDVLAAYDMFPKLTEKKSGATVSIKSKECVCNLLALVGANRSLLTLNNEIALREVRSNANRVANCDASNIRKQVESAAEQIRTIQRMKSDGRFDALGTKLQATAQARIDHPDASLLELANVLGITKSGLVNRLSKLRGFVVKTLQ